MITIIYMCIYIYVYHGFYTTSACTAFHLAPGLFPRLQSLAQDAASTAAHEESGGFREPQVTIGDLILNCLNTPISDLYTNPSYTAIY